MGCDGGSIPKRKELVKQKKKPEQKDKEAEIAGRWKYCALSSEPLRKPIVSCPLGRLYNKEAVIQHLLNKDEPQSNQVAAHIRSLKDIVELNLTENDSYRKGAEQSGEYVDVADAPYICPMIGLEMNGKYKFLYFRQCGCVISERALKEVKSDTCHKCGKPVNQEGEITRTSPCFFQIINCFILGWTEAIVLNGGDQEVKQLQTKMEEERANNRKEKKSKKRKHESESEEQTAKSFPKKEQNKAGPSGFKQEKPGKSIKSFTALLLSDKAKNGYSVPKERASEAFKSLFTTHESAKNKPKNNWVTFNPLYN